MKIYEIIDKMQFEIENASGVPLTNKFMFDKDEMLDMLDDLREAVPEDVKAAKVVREEELRIKQSAQREAANVIKEARETKQHLIEENNITKNARDEADAIVQDAKAEANRLKLKGLEYVAAIIDNTQSGLKEAVKLLEENKNELKGRHTGTVGGREQK